MSVEVPMSPRILKTELNVYTSLCLFQAVGISLETRRIDIFEKAILESVSYCS